MIVITMNSGKVFEMTGVGNYAELVNEVSSAMSTTAAQSNNWVTISGDTESVTVMSGSMVSVEVRSLGTTAGLSSKGTGA